MGIALLVQEKLSARAFFRVKALSKHVDEIGPMCQFLHHFMSSFCANFFVPKNYKAKL